MSNGSESDRRKEYFQEHWEEPDLSADEMSTHPELHYEQHQQEHPKQLKKKKSRGNRKLQRYRAKLRKQGLDQETITTMINNLNNPSRSADERNLDELNPDVNIHDQVYLFYETKRLTCIKFVICEYNRYHKKLFK